MSHPYEGDVTAEACWNALRDDPDTFLVDVRTSAEWNFVGFAQAPEGAHAPIFAEWQSYPAMSVDVAGFTAQVSQAIETAGGSRGSAVYFLCRSGARSMSSAAALTAAGFTHCFNILDGFEGPANENGHRGELAGWKAAGLPWRQK